MCPASGLWGVLVPLWWLAVVYLARNSELGTGTTKKRELKSGTRKRGGKEPGTSRLTTRGAAAWVTPGGRPHCSTCRSSDSGSDSGLRTDSLTQDSESMSESGLRSPLAVWRAERVGVPAKSVKTPAYPRHAANWGSRKFTAAAINRPFRTVLPLILAQFSHNCTPLHARSGL